jgi:SAM-dependent methyltransferase
MYETLQALMGGKRGREWLVNEVIRAQTGDRVLDLGCGTSSILDYLPAVNYYGYDISDEYIQAARRKFGDRGRFEVGILSAADTVKMQKFDIVLALGVLHHMDKEEAYQVMRTAFAALRPGGRLVTLDPCYVTGQNPIARFIISKDRGQNVRNEQGYVKLAHGVFASVTSEVKHWVWVPYTHCVMECMR